MVKNYFQIYLKKKSNRGFWNKPLASEKLDQLIKDKKIQDSIANDKDNLAIYALIEQTIIKDYAALIDVKLRELIKQLKIEYFEHPSGFEQIEKSKKKQKHYFRMRDCLEFFLKQDINQHEHPDAQLNAFRRWINISNELLKRHCYEGFLLIFVNLQLMAKPHLLDGLPVSSRRMYDRLVTLCSSNKNHAALRRYIRENSNDYDLSPLLFWNHAIIVLNDTIESLKAESRQLLKAKTDLKESITLFRSASEQINLSGYENQLKNTRTQRLSIKNIITEQESQRDEILSDIKKARDIPLMVLSENQQKTFQEIEERYLDGERVMQQQLNHDQENIPPSPLYSQKLLPSFWARRGVRISKYWDDIFTPSTPAT